MARLTTSKGPDPGHSTSSVPALTACSRVEREPGIAHLPWNPVIGDVFGNTCRSSSRNHACRVGRGVALRMLLGPAPEQIGRPCHRRARPRAGHQTADRARAQSRPPSRLLCQRVPRGIMFGPRPRGPGGRQSNAQRTGQRRGSGPEPYLTMRSGSVGLVGISAGSMASAQVCSPRRIPYRPPDSRPAPAQVSNGAQEGMLDAAQAMRSTMR